MRNIEFSFEDALIPRNVILKGARKLRTEHKNLRKVLSKGYDDDRCSINLPSDESILREVKRVIRDKLQLNPEYLIVVGIGGSNLGAMAVQEAVLGKLYNQLASSTKVLYADTVDADHINAITALIKPVLQKGNEVILNVISKSGTTTETIANFEVLLNLLRKYKKDYQNDVVVTSDRGSKLWNIALEKGFHTLEIPKKVGGRYSVLSPAGLFPLGLVGIGIEQLLRGAISMRKICIETAVEENPATISASIEYSHYRSGKNISDLFLFSNDLESLGKWYRQLTAESLGKELNARGIRVNMGITPSVSIGSTDLHSMAQLYLGGPYDKLTTFVAVGENVLVNVPSLKDCAGLVSGIRGKNLNDIMKAILKGTKAAFRTSGRPFIELSLPNKSEYSIGQFLQFEMIKIILLANLMNVNPFDQPNVEGYKMETRKILARQKSIQ